MRAVVDTNVWVSGLIAPDGTPGRVLDAVRRGDLEPIVSWELARELVDVLRRPEIRRYGVTEADVDEVLAVLGPLLPDVDISVDIRDPDDAAVVAAAIAGAAVAIVTGDRDLLDDADLRSWLATRGIEVLKPAEVLMRTALVASQPRPPASEGSAALPMFSGMKLMPNVDLDDSAGLLDRMEAPDQDREPGHG